MTIDFLITDLPVFNATQQPFRYLLKKMKFYKLNKGILGIIDNVEKCLRSMIFLNTSYHRRCQTIKWRFIAKILTLILQSNGIRWLVNIFE